VAALDEETAEAALEDIRVEYEPLPTVMSVQEGLAETDALDTSILTTLHDEDAARKAAHWLEERATRLWGVS
jgi:CO/xanthine dehydrogenase Mo-binding subunit